MTEKKRKKTSPAEGLPAEGIGLPADSQPPLARPGDSADNREADPFEEAIETHIASSPTGHRITRRRTNRRVEIEDVDETITEALPPRAFTAPASSHPAPVG